MTEPKQRTYYSHGAIVNGWLINKDEFGNSWHCTGCKANVFYKDKAPEMCGCDLPKTEDRDNEAPS